ncbi:MAG: hypothetical protein M3R63_21260, partial [Actinomycetota bacterium]|nr:hypothetical protein [Actinomycetota bacterium]
MPLDMLKAEMTRLTRDKADAERELATASATLTDLTGQLERALSVASSCNRHYATAPPRIRRQINQGFFQALYLHRDGDIEHVELTEPFAQLLADDLLSTVSASTTALDRFAWGVIGAGEDVLGRFPACGCAWVPARCLPGDLA